jgi:hypothetical protein
MRELRPEKPHLAGDRTLRVMATALLTHSLVLYITAVTLHRVWMVLNSDVMQLIRRVH